MSRTAAESIAATAVLKQPPSPLHGAQFTLDIRDLLVTLDVKQRFRNDESQPIEVSYLCVVPTTAQLLDVQARLGDEVLRGQIEARGAAEDRYETALAEGQSAFCLRMVDDHLLHVALGNLLPGEELELKLRFGWWLQANDGRIRLTVPTTLAPRYGQPQLAAHEQTHSSLLVDYPATLDGRIRGALAGSELACPSHALAVRSKADGELGFYVHNARLDRDIVIDLDAGHASGVQISGSLAADLDGRQAAMIAFCTPQAATRSIPVLAEFVLDCSGSMAGSSIEQSRTALRAIVAQLTPSDRLNVQRFGSQHEFLLRRPQPLTPVIRQTLLEAAGTLAADLGGTELMPALHAALEDLARLPVDLPGERILFIVSDGEVWNPQIDAFVQRCAQLQVRVFAVAVGSAAVESTFLPMVTATGGALERVLPGDVMAARIERHFQRVRQGALREFRVQWPNEPAWSAQPQCLYPGDTGLFACGGLAVSPSGEAGASLSWRDPDGQPGHAQLTLQGQSPPTGAPDDPARMIAARRLPTLADSAALQWAVNYQLLTAHTGLTLVKQRAAALGLDRLPELRIVPQMLAAGWGGSAASGAMAGALPAACPVPSPMQASLQQPISPTRARAGASNRLFKRALAPGAADTESLCLDQQQPDPATALIRLLCVHLVAHPGHAQLLQTGRFSLDQLGQALPVALLNWLDAAAEHLHVELDNGDFWAALGVWLAARDPALAALLVPTAAPRLLPALQQFLDAARL